MPDAPVLLEDVDRRSVRLSFPKVRSAQMERFRARVAPTKDAERFVADRRAVARAVEAVYCSPSSPPVCVPLCLFLASAAGSAAFFTLLLR